MVALEAWALGRPVLANAACDVLHGQCLRSNAGLFYEGFREFFETLRTLDGTPSLAAALGQNGRQYFQRHYSWPVIERKYTDMLDRLTREPANRVRSEPMPGWWARRRRVLEGAEAVVARLPRGAATNITDQPERRPAGPGPEPVPTRPTPSVAVPDTRAAATGPSAPARPPAAEPARSGRPRSGRGNGGRSRPAGDRGQAARPRPANATLAEKPADAPPVPDGQAPRPADGRAQGRRRNVRGRRRAPGGR
jgi:hypothetical protein